MKTIKLLRTKKAGKSVNGFLDVPYCTDVYRASTLENADFIIPDGDYPLDMTWSPKFNKMMPEIQEVPDREGIRIHTGTVPEHSTGCVLVTANAMTFIKSFIEKTKRYDDEPIILSIRTEDNAA